MQKHARIIVALLLLALMAVITALAALWFITGAPNDRTRFRTVAGTELKAVRHHNRPHGDPRRYMHGISAVYGPGLDHITVFYSTAQPTAPVPAPGESWTHDVYLLRWNPTAGTLERPTKFINMPEAQEPVSVAQNSAGLIMVTFEDGWEASGSVTQRYGIYDANLQPVAPYPREIEPGGHSGHVAAVGELFAVFYSDGWVHGGGVDNLGSGWGVYVKVYDGAGNLLHDIDIAHARREWWPVIAGGPDQALLLWQAYVDDATHAELKFSLLDPITGAFSEPLTLNERVQYYTYAASWIPNLSSFIVVSTTIDGDGVAYLINTRGAVTATLAPMPPTVRESSLLVQHASSAIGSSVAFGAVSRIYTPTSGGGLLELEATPHSLELVSILKPVNGPAPVWHPTGSLGLPQASGAITWLTTSPHGLQSIVFHPTAQQGSQADDAF